MKVGDRVVIVGAQHPWRRAQGSIVGTFTPGSRHTPDLRWTVGLDVGTQVAASSRDLRVLKDDG